MIDTQSQTNYSLEDALKIAGLVSFSRESQRLGVARPEGREVLQFGATYSGQFRGLNVAVSLKGQTGQYRDEVRADYQLLIRDGVAICADFKFDDALDEDMDASLRSRPERKVKELYNAIEARLNSLG